jgi:hypothetical protein
MNTIEYKLIAFGNKYLIRDICVIRGHKKCCVNSFLTCLPAGRQVCANPWRGHKIRKHQASSLSGLRLWFTYLMLSGVISTF